MRVLHRYIAADFLVAFALTLSIFTFVMCVGLVVRAIDLIAKGVSSVLILQMFMYGLPSVMMFTIPMSVLAGVLLLFGRLSIDGEINAMRASGLGMWQIISPVIMISIGLTFFSAYLNSSLAPRFHYARRVALASAGVEAPMNLLEAGRFVRDFPGLLIYVGKKSGNSLSDVIVYELDGPRVKLNVRAKTGEIRPQENPQLVHVDLYDVRIDQPDADTPLDPSQARHLNAQHYPVRLDFSHMLKSGKLRKKLSDMTVLELVNGIRNVREHFPELSHEDLIKERMKLVVAANERLTLSIACFAFALLGVPLGMRSRRKESTRGILVSLGLVFGFYFFIVLAKSLTNYPWIRPDLILWLPVIAAEVVGFVMIRRMD